MSVNLQKGQKVDLTKGNTGLKTILVGLGWDEAPRKFSLFSKHEDIDCDASALLISAQTGKLNGPVASYISVISPTRPAQSTTWATT